MNDPAVSVILPVYNCEAYVDKAIRSVLEQTFADFELIIINDGSTDKSESVIRSFIDPRIVYLSNQKNKGLIYSLNRGIETASGTYIARMDADDICLIERLEIQKNFLDQNPTVAMVASLIFFINDKGERTGMWELDKKTTTPKKIRQRLPFENCLAHPTIMIRSEIMKKFKYKSYQKNIEDYDLWLRLLNRKLIIAKLDVPLLLYRHHGNSVTEMHLRKSNPFFKHLQMKSWLLLHEFSAGYLNSFTLKIKMSLLLDLIKGIAKAFKNLFK